jgi:hypothetical protein
MQAKPRRKAVTFILAILTVFIWVLWGGYVTSLLWLWFVVPLGVPAISVLQAAGLSILHSMLTGTRGIRADVAASKEKSSRDTAIFNFGVALAAPGFALLGGWIIHNFMTGYWVINIGAAG